MKIDKCQKFVCNMYDKKHYVVYKDKSPKSDLGLRTDAR